VIEFLQPLVDAVAQAVPAMVKKKERDATAQLGAELFLVYVQSNEALVLAEEIVSTLETYVERMANGDRYALEAGSWVSGKIHDQLRNITAIRNRVERFRWEFQVLDGRASNELEFLLGMKYSALRALAGALDEERMPLRKSGLLIDDQGVLRRSDFQSSMDFEDQRFTHLYQDLKEHSVAMDKPWGPEILAVVKDYLADRKPREHLAKIQASLEQIRAALATHFTISDILLHAGDPRAARRQSL
jgi:hypothetical protein